MNELNLTNSNITTIQAVMLNTLNDIKLIEKSYSFVEFTSHGTKYQITATPDKHFDLRHEVIFSATNEPAIDLCEMDSRIENLTDSDYIKFINGNIERWERV